MVKWHLTRGTQPLSPRCSPCGGQLAGCLQLLNTQQSPGTEHSLVLCTRAGQPRSRRLLLLHPFTRQGLHPGCPGPRGDHGQQQHVRGIQEAKNWLEVTRGKGGGLLTVAMKQQNSEKLRAMNSEKTTKKQQ